MVGLLAEHTNVVCSQFATPPIDDTELATIDSPAFRDEVLKDMTIA